MIAFFVTLMIGLLILFSLLFHTLKNGISPMPISGRARRALLEVLPDMQGGKVIDLGSGWGNLIFPLANQYKNCQVFGYENSLIPFWFSFLINDKQNLKIKRANFYDIPLDDADLIVCYLFPKGMSRLKEKLERELKVGARVVSHTFAVPTWKPQEVIEVNDIHRSKIYLYEIGDLR